MNVKGKGLVILSDCAHAGIINTILYAQEVTYVNNIFVVMGGFHLRVPNNKSLIAHTIEWLKKVAAKHVIPTHCTGRDAILQIEREMPEEFILDMLGTTLPFSA
jgi:7,8-dihydropterin-6-yl-methyl-4-(beta-D-ribofuranosyl)aminobenzene 5'-phosphate synthase